MKKLSSVLLALVLAISLLVGCQDRVAPLGGEFLNLPVTLRGADGSVKMVFSEEGEAGSKTGQLTLFDEATRKAGVLIGTGEISAFDNAGNSYNISGAGNTVNTAVTGDSDLQGNVSSSVGAVTVTDQIYVTDTATFAKGSGNAIVVSTGGVVELPAGADISLDGYMNVGDGTPDGSVAAGTDEELYVEGDFEVDGEAEFDGAIDADSTADFGGAVTCSFAGNCLTSGTTADIEWLGFASFGDGTADGVTDGTAEDVYVEGGLEVDGVIYADGAIDADSTSDFAGTATFSKATGNAIVVTAGGAIDANGNMDLAGNLSSAVGSITATDSVVIDGQADEVQLTAQGYTTQTSHIFVVEETGGTDLFWVTNDGDVEMNGTTPALTIGDAGGEDTQVTFDGAAQDFYMGLYDTDDDLQIGLGAALGTTPIMVFDESQLVGFGAASAGAKVDVTGNLMVDGDTDEIQLHVQAHSTQLTHLAVFETSAGVDVLEIGISGNITGTGNISTTGETQVGTVVNYAEAPVQTITNGTTDITCLKTYSPLTAGGAVGNTMSVTGYRAGDFCILINEGSNAITITDTGTTMLTGDLALGQYDSLTLLFDGTNWIELSASDN